jgi:hypothetical protein
MNMTVQENKQSCARFLRSLQKAGVEELMDAMTEDAIWGS